MTEDASKQALEYFSGKCNCAQSVLKAILEHKGLVFDELTYIAAGFGGGIAHHGTMCGAATGAIMAIGVLTRKEIDEIMAHKDMTYEYSEDFVSRFKQKFGNENCSELIGYDMSDVKARENAIKSGLHTEICPKFVKGAVEILLDMFPD